jgi:predicted MPP superfamily phosphohydrolase
MTDGKTGRALRFWLAGLNFALIAVGVALTLNGTRRALFVVALVPLVFAPFAYARLRLHRELTRVLGQRRMAWLAAVSAGFDVVMVGQLLTARGTEFAAWLNGPAIGWIGPVWFSAHALLFLAYALLGLGRLLGKIARAVVPWSNDNAPASATDGATDGVSMLGRREFLQQYGVVGAAAPFAISLSGVPLSYDFRVDEHEIVLPHWPAAMDGLRIAHLSDIHVGGGMDGERLARVVALTNAAKPDVVVHTGDFLTHRSGEFDAPLYEALAGIDAPYGQWASLGNHDFDDPERLTRKLAEAGVTVLRNRVVTLHIGAQRLEIAGLDFGFGRSAGGYEALFSLWPQRDAPRLLLNHDPRAFFSLPDACADLVLSGHTHGGHIGVQLSPGHALTLVGLAGIPDQGVFERGDMRMFVTRCVGFYGYPMRVGIPPEIALLTLRAPRTVDRT